MLFVPWNQSEELFFFFFAAKGKLPDAAVWLEILIISSEKWQSLKGHFWCVFPEQFLTDLETKFQSYTCGDASMQQYKGSGFIC